MSTFHPSQLQQALELQLRTLGYEICGDEDQTGWYWSIGSHRSLTAQLPFDTIEEATLDAARDLVERAQELAVAAQAVVSRWERGDLAEAVRELAVAAGYLTHGDQDPGEAGQAARPARQQAMR